MSEAVQAPKSEPRKRRRMAPDDRRAQILDAAARIIVEDGVSAAIMERVAREAGVSKPLVYAYFDNRANLLSTLLLREYPAFQGTPVEPRPGDDFESIIRRTTVDFIDRYVANGVLIERLLNEPAVAEDVLRRQAEGRKQVAEFFGGLMHSEFGSPLKESERAVVLLMGVTLSAARMLVRDDSKHDDVVDLTVKIIVGAAEKLGRAD
ncbi:MAG: TetR/AcrR family transcriptional regulator [Pseudomonadota bacterium]